MPVHDRVGVETDDFLLFGEGAEFVSKYIIMSIKVSYYVLNMLTCLSNEQSIFYSIFG